MGNGKGIKIDTSALKMLNNSNILSISQSKTNEVQKGNAGSIDIQASGDITFSNNIIAVLSLGTGDAGSISIDTKGNLFLNKSAISSLASLVSGGNITLNTSDKLLLRNNSSISTTSSSTEKNANGGNILINSPLIIALPASNFIEANANGGAGGNVNIISQGLFGIQYRPKGQATPTSNSITASSTSIPAARRG